jgi:hypothetical protein
MSEKKSLEEISERLRDVETENKKLRNRINELQENSENEQVTRNTSPITRRGALAGITGLGLLGIGATGTASAAESLDFGSSVTGDPGTSHGLRIAVDNADQAVLGISNDASGFREGLRGEANSDSGRGVLGVATSGSGSTNGVFGKANSPKGNGVYGLNTASSGSAKGLLGRSDSSEGIGFEGFTSSSTGKTIGARGRSQSDEGTGILGVATNSSGTTYGVKGKVNSSSGYGLYTPDNCKIEGDLEVSGTKNFVQAVETPSGSKEVAYTAVEAGTPRTETADVAEMEDGRYEIELPDHFQMVTSENEPLNVQITPYAKEKVQPQVVECSTDRIIVEDFSDQEIDYTFAYTVKGTRKGFEDREIVRES